jgi:hypothetical protein
MPAAHEMTRTPAPEPGVEEWSCARCGRRLRLRRPPAFEKIVLDPGDERAAHVGGTGGVRVGPVAASPASPGGPAERERQWLADHGMAWEPRETPR